MVSVASFLNCLFLSYSALSYSSHSSTSSSLSCTSSCVDLLRLDSSKLVRRPSIFLRASPCSSKALRIFVPLGLPRRYPLSLGDFLLLGMCPLSWSSAFLSLESKWEWGCAFLTLVVQWCLKRSPIFIKFKFQLKGFFYSLDVLGKFKSILMKAQLQYHSLSFHGSLPPISLGFGPFIVSSHPTLVVFY